MRPIDALNRIEQSHIAISRARGAWHGPYSTPGETLTALLAEAATEIAALEELHAKMPVLHLRIEPLIGEWRDFAAEISEPALIDAIEFANDNSD